VSLFGLRRPAPPPAPEEIDVPLFPLQTVLFPGGTLSLKVFEQRYLDMSAECLKLGTPFGVCLIGKGREVGAPAVPQRVGTLADVTAWDMEQLGILQLSVRGGRRFRIIDTPRSDAGGLLRARVQLFAELPGVAIPEAQANLVPLLRKIVADLGDERMPEPHRWGDAAWVGYRLAEVMPVQALAKQKLLELDDPVSRLEILFRYLAQRNLVK